MRLIVPLALGVGSRSIDIYGVDGLYCIVKYWGVPVDELFGKKSGYCLYLRAVSEPDIVIKVHTFL